MVTLLRTNFNNVKPNQAYYKNIVEITFFLECLTRLRQLFRKVYPLSTCPRDIPKG